MRKMAVCLLFVSLVAGAAAPALASKLVYKPQSPTFGGNPNLASWMFQLASTQSLVGGGGSGGSGGFGGTIGGPVIVINPDGGEVDQPGDNADDVP